MTEFVLLIKEANINLSGLLLLDTDSLLLILKKTEMSESYSDFRADILF